jgi:mannose-6-phosphate isomerase-like protein (cupin superfamily)
MTGYVGSIEKQTLENTYFRQVLFTAQHAQLVVMCLQPSEEIGDEVHPKVDQFFRIEQGNANSSLTRRKNTWCTVEMRSWFRQGRTTTW